MTPHAQVYFVDRAHAFELIEPLRSHYAVTVIERERWGIGDSRALVDEAYRTHGGGQERLLAVVTTDLSLEAQNALLKIIEEPPLGTSIYFFLAPEVQLLPTVASRVVVVASGTRSDDQVFVQWRAESLGNKLAAIERHLKDKDDAWVDALVAGALAALRMEVVPAAPAVVGALYYALSRVGTRGAANKMLLEEVSLLFSRIDKQGTMAKR